jgi:hypothetical protein
MWSTAVVRAYRLVSSFTVIIKIVLIGERRSHGTDLHQQNGIDSYVKNTSQRLSKPYYHSDPKIDPKIQLSL